MKHTGSRGVNYLGFFAVPSRAIESAKDNGPGRQKALRPRRVEAMRTVMDTVPMRAADIVIGEGERDEALSFYRRGTRRRKLSG